ncbi:MAG: hypothetical protein ABIF01_04930 [Candidatus Micrarchaeota archaeon]
MVLDMFSSPETIQAGVVGLLNFLFSLILAIVVVIVGWAVASVLAGIVKKVLEKIKFEAFLKIHKVDDALGSTKIEKVIVQVVKYYVIVLFLADALRMVQLGTVGTLLFEVVNFAPIAIAGLIVVVVAAVIGELVKEKIIEMSTKSSLTNWTAKAVKIIVIYIGFVVALGTMGFQVTILEQTFLTLLQAITYGVALAFAIAFGLGAQDEAKDVVKKTRKKFNV